MPRSVRTSLVSALLTLSSCAANHRAEPATDQGPSTDQANPQMRAVLEQLAILGPKPIETLSPTEARLQPSASDAVVQLTQVNGVVAPDRLPPVGKVETVRTVQAAHRRLRKTGCDAIASTTEQLLRGSEV